MDIYNLTKVDSIDAGPRSEPMYGFNIIAVHGALWLASHTIKGKKPKPLTK
jgi:hypothetical protein